MPKKRQIRYNTDFLPHYILKLHRYWVMGDGLKLKENVKVSRKKL